MPKCFVVMGFGKKTDYPTNRVLDLDKSYEYIIKPAVTAAGYECVRADEIQHAGNINVPMYQQLLNADVVIADVSTYNPNAFYELGVRHALKPYTTITIAEDKLIFPFDVGQIAIRKYHHLGEGIDFGEVMRMQAELKKAIETIGAQAACDSPVYTFLHGLHPPVMDVERGLEAAPLAFDAEPEEPQPTIRMLMEQADAAMDNSDFNIAKSLLEVVRGMLPADPYVVQRLALATYKSELPTAKEALQEAASILESLSPYTSTDTETLGVYGSVHKHLWELTSDAAYLDKAIWAYEKGYWVKNDHYNGVNMAYLLNERAELTATSLPADAIADAVVARRTRRAVLDRCTALLDGMSAPEGKAAYWVRASLAQAYAGLGDEARAQELLNQAKTLPEALPWMIESTEQRLSRLKELLAKSPLHATAFINVV
jgi:tetratricopeptide (TPR) repeat protein